MNLENLGVQEMNGQELVGVDGGGWRDYVIGYVVGELIDGAIDAFIDHCNSGAGYGGYMDSHGKL